ncbi:MAG: hypothetical protein QM296_13225 [Bacillota bacterium]|nr:hypothetical protein [Bacillota bacterium]
MFPRTTVGGLSLSRMIIGTNWMLGYSHRSVSQDQMIKNRYSRAEAFQPIFDAYMEYGIDTIMGPISQNQVIIDAIRLFEERTGKKLILVDTPIINVDDTAAGRREAESTIRMSAEVGSAFCLIHHSSAEQLVNKNTHEIVRLGDYTDMIRQAGMLPGLSAHMPELIVYSDEQGYDVETYIQIYNCMGFLMQVEIETVAAIIQNAKKPVMTIKSMAAGRVTPFVGLTFSWNTIRERDMITLGAYSPDEVHEDVEISLAAIEHRFPQLERRSSPAPDQAAFGD